MREKAIAVLSGGLDSTVAMSCYVNDYDIEAVTFDYGQKAIKQEIKAAKNICNHYNIPHTVIDLKWLGDISDSALNSDNDIPNPSDEDLDNLDEAQKTANAVWVPGRNIVFTAIATSFAESVGASKIIVGWDLEEANTFPDNSKEFLDAFNNLLNIGSPEDLEVVAPAIDLNKDEIVKLGNKNNCPMELSYSCYTGHDKHCGVCESCMRRKRGFKQSGIEDLTEYEN
ncbi:MULTISPECIES: 7-cyano-7-deazaguanine synthase QueC [Methanobrevibacter]|uniref:7-cyano-7-deazaguanine synthase QueC n=1 Tax=Methanobrevibacter TaxID=2172 RepID=UPI00033481B0|nr:MULTISPECIES: 7-cyano-7-deazaguanine synthase QueC [Methanobrevibacter]AGN16231.1 ExsB protein [Methanobrevibacter sp. AbM4]MCI6775186.1 7-cyano-7-deazaguanine synthase QueC [Methanobrevibacter boviskoreani]MDD6257589.1 7-cyano-7-deazaguanine synthase QueC [Methanobrevibacter boviskoreani]MDY5614542.1 7-cyano-7-deazaguanine synthase QueC [Methanobrevibacter boviskoreani]